MQKESQGNSHQEAEQDQHNVFTRDIGAGLFAVEAHNLQRRDLSYALGYVDVIKIEQNDKRKSSRAGDNKDNDVVHTLHGLCKALS